MRLRTWNIRSITRKNNKMVEEYENVNINILRIEGITTNRHAGTEQLKDGNG